LEKIQPKALNKTKPFTLYSSHHFAVEKKFHNQNHCSFPIEILFLRANIFPEAT